MISMILLRTCLLRYISTVYSIAKWLSKQQEVCCSKCYYNIIYCIIEAGPSQILPQVRVFYLMHYQLAQ